MTRPVLFPLRSVDTAMVRFTDAPHHRRRVTIDHRPLPGIDPVDAVRLVHPPGRHDVLRRRGHRPLPRVASRSTTSRWELARPAPGGGAAEGRGSTSSRHSAAGPNIGWTTSTGWRNSTKRGFASCSGWPASSSSSSNTPGLPAPTARTTSRVLDLGTRSALFAPRQPPACAGGFPDAMARAWVKHNIEEVGQLEYPAARSCAVR